MKFVKVIKSAKSEKSWDEVTFENAEGGFTFSFPRAWYEDSKKGIIKIGVFSGGSPTDRSKYFRESEISYEEMESLAPKIKEGLLQIADEMDSKIEQFMNSLGFKKE